ncbi:Lrp/AsnC family transcriptional regulator [Planktomarina temperata]|nr:Lrp/AsnC family transcriptional regulator [Planktomarina temperata]
MVGTPKLDRIDISILSTLQQQGNITNVNLAEAVGLSPSPCLQRVKRLKKAGYIQNYRAVINLKKLAEHVTVFTEVTLADHRRKDFVKFENEIKNHENVVECHLLSGGYDYLLKFVARGVTQYQEIMEELLERNLGIDKYFSYIVIKPVAEKHAVPIHDLVNRD